MLDGLAGGVRCMGRGADGGLDAAAGQGHSGRGCGSLLRRRHGGRNAFIGHVFRAAHGFEVVHHGGLVAGSGIGVHGRRIRAVRRFGCLRRIGIGGCGHRLSRNGAGRVRRQGRLGRGQGGGGIHAALGLGDGRWRGRANRRLGPEGAADVRIGLDVGGADQVQAVGDGGEDAGDADLAAFRVTHAFQDLADGLGLPGQVDDERVAPDDGGLPRQDGGGHEVQADGAHLLAKSGQFAVGHGQGGLGRDIAGCRAGAAGGEDQVAAHVVGQFAQGLADGFLLVRNQSAVAQPG